LLLALLFCHFFVASPQSHAQNAAGVAPSDRNYAEGLSAIKSGDFPAARSVFERFIKSHPNDAQAHNLLGWVLLAQGDPKSAASSFRIAIRLKPDLADAHINLSSALLQQGQFPEALQQARESTRLSPKSAYAWFALARAQEASGDILGRFD